MFQGPSAIVSKNSEENAGVGPLIIEPIYSSTPQYNTTHNGCLMKLLNLSARAMLLPSLQSVMEQTELSQARLPV